MRNMVRAVNHHRTSAEPKHFNQHWVRTPQQNTSRNPSNCRRTFATEHLSVYPGRRGQAANTAEHREPAGKKNSGWSPVC